ncbi:O-antigen ligase [Methylorubrum rhodinum]|uniref:O-antigen ligase n=1 Tax=Methylorubrum rhodinum TaxID=29428 RepID=A0A840ZIV8_9HYPH|nr:O-antigen ligase family protein [Methylorubrum rhodinum]MBB5757869.1 O-antigen ligase [Methylorubrum rhodinum]
MSDTALPFSAAPAWAGPRAARRDLWRTVFVVFAVLMCVNAFYATFAGGSDELGNAKSHVPSNRGNLLYVGLWLGLYACSCWVVFRDFLRNGLDLCLVGIAPLAGYILLSATWSPAPLASIVPAGMLVLNIVIAAALASVVHPARFLRIFAWTNVVLVGISLALVLITPDTVRTDINRPGLLMSGELFGAYANKTVHGMSASIAILVLLFLPGSSPRGLRWPALGILTLGLILANSMSSVSGTVVAGMTLFAARVLPGFGRPIFTVATGFSILLALSLPFIGIGELATSIGRSADFTGRSTFWPYAIDAIKERPLFGYGYLSFFNTDPFSKAWRLWEQELYFFTPDFHNSFLDIMVGLGIVGGVLYLVLLFTSAAIFAHPSLERRCAFLLSAILIVFILNSATGFLFLAHNRMSAIFQFYCLFVLCRSYRPSVPFPRTGGVPHGVVR